MRSADTTSADDAAGHRKRLRAHNTILDKPPTAVLTWLEHDTPETQQFDQQHNTATSNYFKSIPNATAIRHAIAQSMKQNLANAAPQAKTGGANFMVTDTDSNGAWHISTQDGQRLFGAETVAKNSALDWWYPSPSGAYVVYGVSWDGTEQSVLHVWDVKANTQHALEVPHCSFSKVAWLPNETGFFFSAGLTSDHEGSEKQLRFAALINNKFEVQQSEVSSVVVADPYVSPHVSPDGKFLALTVSWERPETKHLFNIKQQRWEPFLQPVNGRGFGRFTEDSFLLLTTDGAPKGRIVRVPLATHTDPATYQEVVAESSAVLRSLLPLPNGDLLVSELVDGFSQLRLVTASGQQHQIALPPFSLIVHESGLDTSPFYPKNNLVYFRLESYTHPAVQAHVNVHTRKVTINQVPKLDIQIERFVATAKDGTEVP